MIGKITFSKQENRDDYINKMFPERTATDIPGLMNIPGGTLSVNGLTIQFDTTE